MPKRGERRQTFEVVPDSAAVRQPRAYTENREAIRVMDYVRCMQRTNPGWLGLIHYPAELLGYVRPAYRKYWKMAGIPKGFPDFIWFRPIMPYHALMIELKAPGERPTPEQRQWILWLRQQGYAAEWVQGAETMIALMRDYLDGKYAPDYATNQKEYAQWEHT